jgi:D-amino-acid oxidase
VSDENEDNLTYIIPRSNDIIIGGTAQENDWNLLVDPKDTTDILAKAKKIASEFENVTIIEEKVGLRPARDEVRLELEQIGDKSLVHNYGHGGAGFTLSWGCADDVVKLVNGVVK